MGGWRERIVEIVERVLGLDADARRALARRRLAARRPQLVASARGASEADAAREPRAVVIPIQSAARQRLKRAQPSRP